MSKKNDRSSYKYSCPFCGLKVKSRPNLESHIKIKHSVLSNVNEVKKEKNKEETVKTGGGEKMEKEEIQKLIESSVSRVKDTVAQLADKVKDTASTLNKITSELPNIIVKSIQSYEEEKKKMEEKARQETENQRRMKEIDELLKHKDKILSFCEKNPKLCQIEFEKLLSKEQQQQNHLPHETVDEILSCLVCGPKILKGISKNIKNNTEFAKKFVEELKSNKAEDTLKELIEIGRKLQQGGEGGGKPNPETGGNKGEETGGNKGEETGGNKGEDEGNKEKKGTTPETNKFSTGLF